MGKQRGTKTSFKAKESPQVPRQSPYLCLILTKTIIFCGQLPALGQVLLTPSPNPMGLWLLYSSVHIVCSLHHLQDVAAALGTHKTCIPQLGISVVCLDPGLCHSCPQPLSPSGRQHPREMAPALLSLLLLRCIPSASVSTALTRTLVLQRNKRFIKPLRETPTGSSGVSVSTIPMQIPIPVLAQHRINS